MSLEIERVRVVVFPNGRLDTENACRYIERVQDRPIRRRMAETAEELRDELREIEEEAYRDHADAIAPARAMVKDSSCYGRCSRGEW
jgi:hypothetical protein